MNRGIRRQLNINFFLACLVCSLIAAFGVWGSGEYMFRTFYQDVLQDSLDNAAYRLNVFDEMMFYAELQARKNGNAVLRRLGEQFRNKADVEALSREDLRALADSHAVSEIYFIDSNGIVFATSFLPDRGLNLFKAVNSAYAARLKSLYGTGQLAEERLSQSVRTGIINAYQYYSAPGSDFLIETSTTLRTAVQWYYPETNYDALLSKLLITEKDEEYRGSLVNIKDFLVHNGSICWSLYREGTRRDDLLPLVLQALDQTQAVRRQGSRETRVILMPKTESPVLLLQTDRFGVLEIDRSPLLRFRLLVGLSFVFAVIVSMGLSFLVFRRAIFRHIVLQTEKLSKAIKASVVSGDFSFRTDGLNHDELEEIAASVAQLSQAVQDKTRTLYETVQDKNILLREVQHRVRNNLQILLSLINLKMTSSDSVEVNDSLMVFKNHIYSMALVEEQIHSRTDKCLIPAAAFLEELAQSVSTAFPEIHSNIELVHNSELPALRPETAIPLGLIISELVTNSMKHGFKNRRSGLVLIRCSYDKGMYGITVSDDGCGSDSSRNSNGIGLVLLRVLAVQLSARLELKSDEGWLVSLSFPYIADEPVCL